ncbi:ABC transporter permease [Niastella yeongjuensis]|uniref:ABC transporter permease n=1 Tax=Niastella yeongjuensis TaxID=354355 RepID=A0A1V9F7M6_9BACT|nr:ABC transporter permease [Niastella yeongjuensis]OQP54271.1 ABC transporter permease [Niastella yeongjuensis]SEP31020.1 ABC-type antimicrobial peptide transport system, permease component [Niastella yeongjuensis]
MFTNYLKTAWRNLFKSKVSSIINISGLAVGMAVAILIALWVYDEVSYDTYHKNYDRIVQVMQHQLFNGKYETQMSNPYVMAEEIRRTYGNGFKYVIQSSWNYDHGLVYGDKIILQAGSFMEPEMVDMLSLKILAGSKDGLREMNSIILSQSVATAIFGKEDPIGKMVRVDNKSNVKVTAVYEDLPDNTSFRQLTFVLPWQLYLSQNQWIKQMETPWGSNFTQTYAQVADNVDIETLSKRIRDVKLNKTAAEDKQYKPIVFLHPMRKWHLYEQWKEGINTGGRIETVWLFGIIGIFVLLLACINFMNLSTARSEKRAKEVGVRKTIGSNRKQLVVQFFSESVLTAVIAFVFSILLVSLIMPFFNSVADKKMAIPWLNPLFWLIGICLSILTGLLAGVYPALFLSSFQPVKVLKGTYRVGRFASLPRKVLVVAQFTISIVLIIGTIIVYKQINLGMQRPIGYVRDGLISHDISEVKHKHFEALRSELKNSGAVVEMAESGSPTTGVWNTNGGFDWEGKDPNFAVDFPNNANTWEYGKTIGWKIKQGRDFSREFASDSTAFILNESAVAFMGLKDPIGKIIHWNKKPYHIIGVVEDMLVQSPYKPVRAALWHISTDPENLFIMKMNPTWSVNRALAKIESIFKKYDPASPFKAQFADEQFAEKFDNEKRIGQLSTFFAILAVFISCLGLFGLTSFMAEQRVKEIGIRNVLGASMMSIWQLLSKDFILLVCLSCLIAIPIASYYMHTWLQKYDFRTDISWWVFALSAGGALVITLITVSFQAIKAALANPVKSLRTE